MTRTLAFAAVLAPLPAFPLDPVTPAVDLDPWSATAEQIALVLADIRSWDCWVSDEHGNEADAKDVPDAVLIAQYRDTVSLPGVYCPGALEFSPYGDEALDAAWIAMLTPTA